MPLISSFCTRRKWLVMFAILLIYFLLVSTRYSGDLSGAFCVHQCSLLSQSYHCNRDISSAALHPSLLLLGLKFLGTQSVVSRPPSEMLAITRFNLIQTKGVNGHSDWFLACHTSLRRRWGGVRGGWAPRDPWPLGPPGTQVGVLGQGDPPRQRGF